MQRISVKIRPLSLVPQLSAMLLVASIFASQGASAQQSIADNLRPVGRVCMAGQSCVGSPAGGSIPAAAPATVTQAASSAPTALAPVASEPVASEPAAAPEPEVAAATSEPEVAAEASEPEVAAATSEPEVAAFDAATVYQQSCFACHGTGAAGAPELGDPDAWSERMEKGMDAVMANVITGINAMPPKGLCMTCSDDDLIALVEFMVNQ